MMRKSFKHLFSIAAAGLLASCSIENDIKFPEIHADITAFEVEGQVSSKIDIKTNSVSVVLGEDVKMNDLIIKNLKYTDKAKCSDVNFAMGKKIDLSSPYQVTLSTFKSYIWTISATQPIERYFRCKGQQGEASIHVDTRRISVKVNVNKNSAIDSRSSLEITEAKLGIKGSEIVSTTDSQGNVTAISGFPVVLDCFYERTFTVREPDGTTTDWKMIALPAE